MTLFPELDANAPVRCERRGAVLEVTLDRPKANAIDAATSRVMGQVFAAFRDDPELRVAILTGGGQKFRLRTQIGTQRQDYLASFVEPWFLGRKLSLSVDLYHRNLNFQSSEYNERRTGAKVGLTRALGSDFLIGSVYATAESVGLFKICADPLVAFQSAC